MVVHHFFQPFRNEVAKKKKIHKHLKTKLTLDHPQMFLSFCSTKIGNNILPHAIQQPHLGTCACDLSGCWSLYCTICNVLMNTCRLSTTKEGIAALVKCHKGCHGLMTFMCSTKEGALFCQHCRTLNWIICGIMVWGSHETLHRGVIQRILMMAWATDRSCLY